MRLDINLRCAQGGRTTFSVNRSSNHFLISGITTTFKRRGWAAPFSVHPFQNLDIISRRSQAERALTIRNSFAQPIKIDLNIWRQKMYRCEPSARPKALLHLLHTKKGIKMLNALDYYCIMQCCMHYWGWKKRWMSLNCVFGNITKGLENWKKFISGAFTGYRNTMMLKMFWFFNLRSSFLNAKHVNMPMTYRIDIQYLNVMRVFAVGYGSVVPIQEGENCILTWFPFWLCIDNRLRNSFDPDLSAL